MNREMHGFLFNKRGGLSTFGKNVSRIREYAQGLRDLTATFRIQDVPGDTISGSSVNGVDLEFLQSWKMSEDLAKQNKKARYINPNYKFRPEYSDVIVECACGALLSRLYDDKDQNLRNEHDHSEDCLEHKRSKAKADLKEKRWNTIKKLYWLGWDSESIGKRLNTCESSVLSLIRRNEKTAKEMKEPYWRAAGNTYYHLVHNEDLAAEKAEDIYDTHRATLNEWYNEYGDAWVDDFVFESRPGGSIEWWGEYW